jgi:hypothetical protein
MGWTPKTLTGTLSTNQVALYKVPEGKWALVVDASLCVSAATARNASLFIRTPGDTTPRAIVRLPLTGGVAVGNDWSLADERWILTAGTIIEGVQTGASDVDYMLSILERDL